MNVNCKVSLTDEQRNVMYRRLSGKSGKGMVSRSDVNKFVNDRIEKFLNGVETKSPLQLDEEKPRTIDLLDPTTHDAAFKPSRGDEPYLLKVKNESLRQIHSRMLDCIEDYEAAVREQMERNEK